MSSDAGNVHTGVMSMCAVRIDFTQQVKMFGLFIDPYGGVKLQSFDVLCSIFEMGGSSLCVQQAGASTVIFPKWIFPK